MASIWTEALTAWLRREPGPSLDAAELPAHLQRDIGLGPWTERPHAAGPIRDREKRSAATIGGLQVSRR